MNLSEQTAVARDLRVYIENPRALTPQQKYELFDKLYQMGLSMDRHWTLDTGGRINVFKEVDMVYIVYASFQRGIMLSIVREDKGKLTLTENGKSITFRDMKRLTVQDIFYQVMQLREDWRSGEETEAHIKLKEALDIECAKCAFLEDGQDKIMRVEKDVYYFKKGDYPFFFFRIDAQGKFLLYQLS